MWWTMQTSRLLQHAAHPESQSGTSAVRILARNIINSYEFTENALKLSRYFSAFVWWVRRIPTKFPAKSPCGKSRKITDELNSAGAQGEENHDLHEIRRNRDVQNTPQKTKIRLPPSLFGESRIPNFVDKKDISISPGNSC